MEKQITNPNIYEYDNYRNFLKDYFVEQKRLRTVFSHRFFASRAGFSSSGFCAHVIDGKRNLSSDSIQKMIKGLGLKGRSASYFETLVLFNQAQTIELREKHFKALERIRKGSTFFKLNQKQYAYYDEWYYPVIRELVIYSDWKNDYVKLAHLVQPAITPEKARAAVDALIDMGLILKVNESTYIQSEKIITGQDVPSSVTRKARKEYLLKSIDAIEKFSVDERHIASATIAMSELHYKKAIEMLDDVRKKIIEMSEESHQVDAVFQVNIQAFPISKKIGKKQDEISVQEEDRD